MVKAQDPNYRLSKPPARKPSRYAKEVLELARGLEENGTPVLNPRDLSVRSLFRIDSEFRRDLNLHILHIRFKFDKLRPKPESPKP